MLFAWCLSLFSLPGLAFGETTKECLNVARFQASLESSASGADHTKFCVDSVNSIHRIWAEIKVAKSKAVQRARVRDEDSQASALGNTASVAEAGSETKVNWAKIAADSRSKFLAVGERLERQIGLLDRETKRVVSLPSVAGTQKLRVEAASDSARQDLVQLKKTAEGLALEASQLASSFQSEAGQLAHYSEQSDARAQRLSGGQNAPAKEGISRNLLIGLGGAAVITAAGIGGLYWVSQKAIKKADSAAAARISQAQGAANQVIDHASETAKQFIQFAINSANQIIANAAEAANRIYEKAKTDFPGMLSQLRSEMGAVFPNLTDAGLAKLQSESQTMFSGMIARAKAEGKNDLATNLQAAMDSLNGQIQQEVARRKSAAPGAPTSSSTAASTATNSATSTATNTSTNTAPRQ